MEKGISKNNFLFVWNNIKTLLSGKVDKVDGKQLSTNDYTNDEKNKLSGISNGANKTTIVNSLTSTSTTSALSAAQGRALKLEIEAMKQAMIDIDGGNPSSVAEYSLDGGNI